METVPPAYPGSDLLLAVPGKALPLTAALRNEGVAPLRNVTLTLQTPGGWGSEPTRSVNVKILTPGSSVTGHWIVTPPLGAVHECGRPHSRRGVPVVGETDGDPGSRAAASADRCTGSEHDQRACCPIATCDQHGT
jgi:hypothetical protein